MKLKYRELLPPGVELELDQLVKAIQGFLQVEHNEDGTHIIAPIAAAISEETTSLLVGSVIPYAGTAVPTGVPWLLCDGTAISRSTYRTLFDVIGTNYGGGDGATTFNLPDLRRRFPLGKSESGTGSVLGEVGGSIDHTHTGPSHTHTSTTFNAGGGGTPVATSPTDPAGAGNTGSANPPYQVLNYIILYA